MIFDVCNQTIFNVKKLKLFPKYLLIQMCSLINFLETNLKATVWFTFLATCRFIFILGNCET